jgi:hypothetical protein
MFAAVPLKLEELWGTLPLPVRALCTVRIVRAVRTAVSLGSLCVLDGPRRNPNRDSPAP